MEETTTIISHNRLEEFIPVEFALLDWKSSWKKCRCGRVALLRDNWCGGCGQKLGMPAIDD